MSFFLSFIFIPWACALFTATTAAPLGSLIAWRRLIYFGEALSHASLLGIAVALFFNWPLMLGIWASTLLMVALLYFLRKHSNTDPNNILGTLAHWLLALGLIAIASQSTVRTDLLGYLFGDILSTNTLDLAIIALASIVTLAAIKKMWQPLILMTINEDIARTENPRSAKYDLIFLLLLGVYIGIMVQFLGMMLVMAFLIIPVQTTNLLAKNPEQCVRYAALLSAIAATGGFWIAYQWNLPVSPAIVALLGVAYFAVHLGRIFLRPRERG